jgi:hypothetical protein
MNQTARKEEREEKRRRRRKITRISGMLPYKTLFF